MAQDILSTSVLKAEIVCKFNLRITSYSEQTAFLRIFSSRQVEILVFTTRAMSHLPPCFMTLALPKVACFIARTLLSLANRCEPSLHDSPSWVLLLGLWTYNVIFWCKESVADFDCVVYVRIVYLFDFIEVGFLGNAFIFTIAIIFCIAFLKAFCKWNIGGRWFGFLYRYLRFPMSVRRLFSVSTFLFAGWVLISG